MLLIPLAIIAVYIIYTYNSFISLRNRWRNAWADVDVQLKRRYDLIPNLVETVKGYASHEQAVLEDVTRLRAEAANAGATSERGEKEAEFAGAVRTLFAVAESYPNLRADQNFRQLQTQLTEIEDTIQYARRYYNAVVRDFNTKRELIPSNLVAKMFGFQRLEYFQVEEDERAPVDVKFTTSDE